MMFFETTLPTFFVEGLSLISVYEKYIIYVQFPTNCNLSTMASFWVQAYILSFFNLSLACYSVEVTCQANPHYVMYIISTADY